MDGYPGKAAETEMREGPRLSLEGLYRGRNLRGELKETPERCREEEVVLRDDDEGRSSSGIWQRGGHW